MEQRMAKAIKRAMDFEIHGKAFFIEAASKVKSPLAKKMFEQIASEEDEHMKYISTISKKLNAKHDWPDFKIEDNSYESRLKEVFISTLKAEKEKIKSDQEELDIIEQAVRIEENGRKMYMSLYEEAAEGFEKDFYKTMADMEYSHFRSFKDTHLYLSDPEAWFMEQEKAGLDG